MIGSVYIYKHKIKKVNNKPINVLFKSEREDQFP